MLTPPTCDQDQGLEIQRARVEHAWLALPRPTTTTTFKAIWSEVSNSAAKCHLCTVWFHSEFRRVAERAAMQTFPMEAMSESTIASVP